jgi:hypothetical protein
MIDWILTVGSWEMRFREGFFRDIDKLCPKNVLLCFYKEYASWSALNRRKAISRCKKQDISIKEIELSFTEYTESWRKVYDSTSSLQLNNNTVLVDLTTMPRETIWYAFNLLEEQGAKVTYSYHQPIRYNKEWLSRDPGKPRLIYKLSGEQRLGLPTKLVILTGFDVDRVKQLIRFFEPQHTYLGIQVGTQLSNKSLNIDKNTLAFIKKRNVELFDVDAYTDDHGFEAIKRQIEPHILNSNIVMSSLGPKLSAVALYKIQKYYPQTSLAYAPSNEFNRKYSFGIGDSFYGSL